MLTKSYFVDIFCKNLNNLLLLIFKTRINYNLLDAPPHFNKIDNFS